MSRLQIQSVGGAQHISDSLYADLARRIAVAPPTTCPVDMALGFLSLCHAQSCGKCVPCRIGLAQLKNLLLDVLRGTATQETLNRIATTAQSVYASADCAIGYDAAQVVLSSLEAFSDDYHSHIQFHRCKTGTFETAIPCMSQCPAGVDVPGYVSLVHENRCQDAVQLIRQDNPFPTACAYICEHPCEEHCRRKVLDSAINIRGLKRYAVDTAGIVPPPKCAPPTGKHIAIIGGGPSGLSAAYYLSLMGHSVSIYEKSKRLGGMLRYGITDYRLPRELLDRDINAILETGVTAYTNTTFGVDITYQKLIAEHHAVLIAMGAHIAAKVQIPGEELPHVLSAIEFLRRIGDGTLPSLHGKRVVVIGGGNVAMDASRTAIRLGAEDVRCVYRRRREDMTALLEEVEGAIAEGVALFTLKAPIRIEENLGSTSCTLWVQPQIPGLVDKGGRPTPCDANLPEECMEADYVITAVGQKTDTQVFEKVGLPIKYGALSAMSSGQVFLDGMLFAAGECASKPASAIKAIASGKVAAANIDQYLGFHHIIQADVDIPKASTENKPTRGRIDMTLREANTRKNDFLCIEHQMSQEESYLESSRCLHCDHFGCGSFKKGSVLTW